MIGDENHLETTSSLGDHVLNGCDDFSAQRWAVQVVCMAIPKPDANSERRKEQFGKNACFSDLFSTNH